MNYVSRVVINCHVNHKPSEYVIVRLINTRSHKWYIYLDNE